MSKSGIHESKSEGREVHPAGRTLGALEGWTVFPGVGARVGVQMVVPTAPQQGCCSGASTSVRGPAGAGMKEEGQERYHLWWCCVGMMEDSELGSTRIRTV